MNRKDISIVRQVIQDLEMNQHFKEVLLSVLKKSETKTINEGDIQLFLKKIIEIREEIDIYELLYKNNLIESVVHLLVKEILRYKSSRKIFYQEINTDLGKPLVGNWRTYLFIGLFEHFMCNTNNNELNTIFKGEIEKFYNFFYKLILTDIDEHYESNKLLYFNDCEMWRVFGKSFSKYIKNKIQNCITENNIEEFYKIYPKFFNALTLEDLIHVFDYQGLNLIQFLLNNVSYDDLWNIGYLWHFDFEKKEEEQIIDCINETLLHILPKYEVNDWDDPLYLLDFFYYLKPKHINLLIEDPQVDFFELLMKDRCSDSINNNEYLKSFLKDKKLNLKPFIQKILREGSTEKLFWFWDRWIWDVIDINDFREFLEDKEFNFVEAILKSVYYHYEKEDYGFNYHFPEKIKTHLRPQVQEQIIQVIKNGEKESVIPLLAMRLLDFFEPEELLSLIEDKELNLLNRIDEAIENHYEIIIDLNEGFYRWKINFYKFLLKFNIPINDKIIRDIEEDERLFSK